jgi:ParB-like chromosome segregation protein Spo0J
MAPRSKKAVVAQVVEIERERIVVDAGQVRQEPGDGVQELAMSFTRGSSMPPLVVTDLGNGTYRLVDGERRWMAAGIAGLERVPCIVQEPRSYLETRIEQMQRNNALPMTPLEWALGSYNAYLAANIAALAAEQGREDPTVGLVEAGLKATEQRERLEGWLQDLAGVPVATYLTSGQVRVPRRVVFERLGKPTSDAAIKKMWAPLRLPTEILEQLEGTGVSTRTMSDLAELPAEAQVAAVNAALAAAATTGGDVAATLRQEITARRAGADEEELAAPDDEDEEGLVATANEERDDDDPPDPSLALPFRGSAAAMRSDGPEPGRGTVPPADMGERWPQDLVVQFHAGLEALLGVFDSVGPARLDEAQQRLLSAAWGEVLERAEQAGLL